MTPRKKRPPAGRPGAVNQNCSQTGAYYDTECTPTRAERRQATADLRALGCACNPRFQVAPRHPDFGRGLVVAHQAGCPFGDKVRAANTLGRTPIVIATRSRR